MKEWFKRVWRLLNSGGQGPMTGEEFRRMYG